jgi:hypothetical protein
MRPKQDTSETAGQGAALRTPLICLLLLLVSITTVYASGGPTYRAGAVFTKSLILQDGKRIYVGYDEDGSIAEEIGVADGPYARAKVMSAPQYRAYLTQLDQLKIQYPDLELVNKADYQSAQYLTVDGQLIKAANQSSLASATLTLALRPLAQRLSTDPSQLILLELPIDPAHTPASSQSRSLLLGEDGAILHDSRYNIGYKTGYSADAEGNETGGDLFTTKKFYGPIVGVTVENTLAHTSTGKDGRYLLNYPLPPCPGFHYRINLNLYTINGVRVIDYIVWEV